jgi:hypothetical protein
MTSCPDEARSKGVVYSQNYFLGVLHGGKGGDTGWIKKGKGHRKPVNFAPIERTRKNAFTLRERTGTFQTMEGVKNSRRNRMVRMVKANEAQTGRRAGNVRYEIKPIKETCYVSGCAIKDFVLDFEDAEESGADVFSVYRRGIDGCLQWIADFGERSEAERWKKAVEIMEEKNVNKAN